MAQSFMVDVGAIALGLVSLRSFLGKIRDIPGFLQGVRAYRLLPAPLAMAYGLAVLPAEGAVAACLLTGWHRPLASALLLLLLLSFAIGVIGARRQRLDIACHCFGGDETERVSQHTLVRLGLLLLLGVLVFGAQLADGVSPVYAPMPGWLSYGVRMLGAIYLLVIGTWLLAAPGLVPEIRWSTIRSQSAR